MLRFNADGILDTLIETVTHSYRVSIDPNNTNRVFANYLEFRVNHSQSFSNSWMLKEKGPDIQQFLRKDCATVLALPIDNRCAIHPSVIVVSSCSRRATRVMVHSFNFGVSTHFARALGFSLLLPGTRCFHQPPLMISFLRYWLPLLLWMALIFSASADAQSTQRTSRFLEPFLRWLNPEISPEAIEAVRWLIRKTAHLTEYAVLAWLSWPALRQPVRRDTRPWSWKLAAAALAIVILYAATDEFHQTFVPNRTGSWSDVCIDTAGGALGLTVMWLCYRRRRSGQ